MPLTRPEADELKNAAAAAAKHAYAPYSKFRVGAALLTNDGRVFSGCNVENASYGLTICAERNATFAAVASGGQGPLKIRAVAVWVRDGAHGSPCGACRQVLAEFDDGSTVFFRSRGKWVERPLRDLLPESFSFR